MKIIKAKTAGFCFGVDRAVKLTYGLLEQGVRVATLGPLIHNPQCVADLAARGAVIVDTPEQVPDGYEVVVRSHGVPQCVYDALGEMCIRDRVRTGDLDIVFHVEERPFLFKAVRGSGQGVPLEPFGRAVSQKRQHGRTGCREVHQLSLIHI